MKFTVTTSGKLYSKERATKLGGLGFAFEQGAMIAGESLWIDKKMTSEVEINTLDELMAFVDTWTRPGWPSGIVLSLGEDGEMPTIEIYDDYRE